MEIFAGERASFTSYLMHLNSLTMERFRSCESTVVDFQDDLTVLVGENNGGKSNIIDAIRMITQPLSGRRERYAEDEDIRRGAGIKNFKILGKYAGLSDTLKGLLVSAVPDQAKSEAQFGYKYEASTLKNPRGKSTLWAGKFETAEPEPGSTELIRHVYLPPLRDAAQSLGSGNGMRVMALFRHFLAKDKEVEFLDSVKRGPTPAVLTTINAEIANSLGTLTDGVRPQQAKLDFATESLLDVARDLRFKLADVGVSLGEIRSSGLGYANLLYMATVVVELAKAREADLTLFLVEEPEAHLHPQLQMLVLEFLLEKAKLSGVMPADHILGQPEGRIQVIVTTHSPNLTAWVSPKHLVVVRARREAVQAQGAAPATTATSTVAVAVAKLGLSLDKLDKINRYLDVTRSALLFGNRTLLVEGIAELLLLPIIARRHVFHEQKKALARFKGAVLIAIEGVDFRPYVEVLLSPHQGATIADCVVVITDADPAVPGNRKLDLEGFAAGVNAAGKLSVLTNAYTLEHELLTVGNEAFMKKAFLSVHPNSGQSWTDEIEAKSVADRPSSLIDLLKAKKTRKGDFAQAMAAQIEAGDAFVVPGYLKAAIERIAEL